MSLLGESFEHGRVERMSKRAITEGVGAGRARAVEGVAGTVSTENFPY